MKKILCSTLFIFIYCNSIAQKNDGTVSSLIKTEKNLNEFLSEEGLSKAFLKYTSDKGVVFRPNAINIKEYYHNNPSEIKNLSWEPEFAMISKDGDLGFTSGLYTLNKEEPSYGHYLSIWKSKNQKKWELVLDADIEHKKPLSNPKTQFLDPTDYKYSKLIGPKKIKMREDIVFSTDLLLSKALDKSGNKNLSDFYSPNVRLYFPGQIPVTGKSNVLNFIYGMGKPLICFPNFVDRAFSGDLAYTNGKASIGINKYNYIRIWQKDIESKWNIILDMYVFEE
ncbi:hypothetical protein A5893_14705 [Pedobacter psychrophilus]|uniref:DUF4440 domain-containing protein n=1 Tax=Pedobacter psychrophilus TaxID=1826909 RepID=A0A179DDV1_9SPHI|nr:hypothetical protein [Pedobacter psychrophilus]OAQ38653.1 hypothetical protein A5893_14705 [Pedobacter psychrophilus]